MQLSYVKGRVGKEREERRGYRDGGERKKQSCQHNQLTVVCTQTVQVQMTLEGGRREKRGEARDGGEREKHPDDTGRWKEEEGRNEREQRSEG